MKTGLALMIILLTMNVNAQKMNKKIEDKSRNKTLLINKCSREGLVSFPEFKESFDAEYPIYKADSVTLDSIKPLLRDIKITVVLGTWCGDSKLLVPHFFKVIDGLGIKENEITIIAVDGSKKAEGGILDGLKIEFVPTIILYEKEKELGRITENPLETLEKDIFHILAKK